MEFSEWEMSLALFTAIAKEEKILTSTAARIRTRKEAKNNRVPEYQPRTQLKQVFEAIRQLMTPPDPPRRPIGFVTPGEKKEK